MPQPLVRTKRAARLSLAVSVLALVAFVLLLALQDDGRRIWAWGSLLSLTTATFSVITAVRAPQ